MMEYEFDYDKSDIVNNYNAARALPKETLDLWLKRISDYLAHPISTIVDLGCGSGVSALLIPPFFRG